MKKYLLIVIIVFYSCNSVKRNGEINQNNTIPYIFPIKVTLLISDYLKDNNEIVYFHLSKSNNDWILTFVKSTDTNNNWIINTNRKVYVNKNFYPLIFQSDEIFSVKETGSQLISSNTPLFNRETFLYHNMYHIIFESNDTIKYHGY